MNASQPTPDVRASQKAHPELYRIQGRYLKIIGLITLAIVVYYIWFFETFGVDSSRVWKGMHDLGLYFTHMFIWDGFFQWPFGYYISQILVTLAIVFSGTITATLIALLLAFVSARTIMRGPVLGPIGFLIRRILDVLRGIDMAVWGLIFVRAVGLGPLAGALAIVVQDMGLLGRLFGEAIEGTPEGANKGLAAVGAGSVHKHRFATFSQLFPVFLSLSLYQIESNTRTAAVLGFVGAGGIGLVYSENMRLWNWDVVMFITILLVAVVMLMDALSSFLRRRYIKGETIPLFTGVTPGHNDG